MSYFIFYWKSFAYVESKIDFIKNEDVHKILLSSFDILNLNAHSIIAENDFAEINKVIDIVIENFNYVN